MNLPIQESQEEQQLLSYHGGNVTAAMDLFPNAPRPWLDLSTGINPVPFPIGDLPGPLWTRLPQAADITALEVAARRAYGLLSPADVIAGPGSQALIQWLPRLFPCRRVGVLDFTYAEHETCWRAAGALVTTVATPQELTAFDHGIVVNPNNPDGRIVGHDVLTDLARSMDQHGGRLIVDEAFMDLEDQVHSFARRLPLTGAIVLRSVGKTYGLAGLRLGFAVGSTEDCARLRQALGPWSVSGPAIEVGRRALLDETWRIATAARLTKEGARLDAILRSAGFHVVGGTRLFRLARHADSTEVFRRLCDAGILVRPFQTKPDFLRFGIPHQECHWERLITALKPRMTDGNSLMS